MGGAFGAIVIVLPPTEVTGSRFPFEETEGSEGGVNIFNVPDDERAYAMTEVEDSDVGDAYPTARISVSNGMDATNVPSGADSSSSSSSIFGSCQMHAKRSLSAADMKVCCDEDDDVEGAAHSNEITGEA